jgi:hypothetical protein
MHVPMHCDIYPVEVKDNPTEPTMTVEVRIPDPHNATDKVLTVVVAPDDNMGVVKAKFMEKYDIIESVAFLFTGKPVQDFVSVSVYSSFMEGRNVRFDAAVLLRGGGKRGRSKQEDEGTCVEAVIDEMKKEIDFALGTVENQTDPTFIEAATAIRQLIHTLSNDTDNVEFLRMLNRLSLEKLRGLNLLSTKNYDYLWAHLGVAFYSVIHQKLTSKKTDAQRLLTTLTNSMKFAYTKQFYSGKNYDNEHFKRAVASALERVSKNAGRQEAAAASVDNGDAPMQA